MAIASIGRGLTAVWDASPRAWFSWRWLQWWRLQLGLLTPARPSSSSSPHLNLSAAASRCSAGAITLPLARPRRPIVGLGQRFSHLRLRYFGLGSIWGGVKRGERFPPRAHAWPAVSSSSPHLSLLTAAPRCFTGATTLLLAVPFVLSTSGCGSVCLRTLVLLGASYAELVCGSLQSLNIVQK